MTAYGQAYEPYPAGYGLYTLLAVRYFISYPLLATIVE